LFDPDELVLDSDEIRWQGTPQPGMVYIKTFTGGVELLGLSNWGMHYTDPETGEVNVIHGEVSHIPVEQISVTISEDELEVQGSLTVRSFKGAASLPWYERGKPLYTVTKKVVLKKGQPALFLTDTIANVSAEPLTPDWGYHVTFRPEPGAELFIPSKVIQNRGGEPVPPKHEKWQPSGDGTRVEVGIIHKEPRISPDAFGDADGVESLLVYPDGTGIAVTTSPAPYFQTWFCAGGAYTQEFTYPDGTPVLTKNWDGQGIEFGASPLDHDGNVDPSVVYDPVLQAGESMAIKIDIEVLSPQDAVQCKAEIQSYNRTRVTISKRGS
jgi:galactose mutarotase-like enzyme